MFENTNNSLPNFPKLKGIDTDKNVFFIKGTNIPEYIVDDDGNLLKTQQGQLLKTLLYSAKNKHMLTSREFRDPLSILKEMLYSSPTDHFDYEEVLFDDEEEEEEDDDDEYDSE